LIAFASHRTRRDSGWAKAADMDFEIFYHRCTSPFTSKVLTQGSTFQELDASNPLSVEI